MERLYTLGLDCSFRNCGWSILSNSGPICNPNIEAAGIIKAESYDCIKHKTIRDLRKAESMIKSINDGPVLHLLSLSSTTRALAYEVQGGSQSARAAGCLGIAKGVLAAVIVNFKWFANLHVNTDDYIVDVLPSEVKKETGLDKPDKNDIINLVVRRFNLTIETKKRNTEYKIGKLSFNKGNFEHIADSIVIATAAIKMILKE